MLSLIAEKLGALVGTDWALKAEQHARHVKLYRDYEIGNHRAKLTKEMKAMLRITGNELDQFNANYCAMVIDAKVDRLVVTGVEAKEDAASAWCAELFAENRFDALQMDVHAAGCRDGETYVMIEPTDTGLPKLVHEEAYDGTDGVIAIYDRTQKNMMAVVKIWWEADAQRVNFYFPDRVEKYRGSVGIPETEGAGVLSLQLIETLPWTLNGMPRKVPFVRFINKKNKRTATGVSELLKVIPMQDVFNRTLVSLVATSELTAFQIMYLIGAKLPEGLTVSPGMILEIAADGLEKDQQTPKIGVLAQGKIDQLIDVAAFAIEQIFTVSRTPLMSGALGGQKSGEYLKMLETGLLGWIRGAHVRFGNAWEDVVAMAAELQQGFGTTATPVGARWACQWMAAELRNDTEVVDNALKIVDQVSQQEFLRIVAPVYGWDADKIRQIIEEKARERTGVLAEVLNRTPGFGGLN